MQKRLCVTSARAPLAARGKNGRERARARFWPSRGDARGARGRPKRYFSLLFRPPAGGSKTWFIDRALRPNSSPGGVLFRARAFFFAFFVFSRCSVLAFFGPGGEKERKRETDRAGALRLIESSMYNTSFDLRGHSGSPPAASPRDAYFCWQAHE